MIHLNKRNFLSGLATAGVASVAALGLSSRSFAMDGMNLNGQGHQAPAPDKGGVPDMYLGSDDAPITIIEYASLTCSHCADFHMHTLPELKKAYIDTGHVKYIWRHFILNGPDMAASLIARCAGPDRFFPMIDLFFTRQADWITPWQTIPKPGPKTTLKDMALEAHMDRFVRPAGIPADKVAKCLTDEKLQQEILTTRQDGAKKYDIKGTPTIIIDGEVFNGAHDFETLNTELKKHL